MNDQRGLRLKQTPTWVVVATFVAALLSATTAWSQSSIVSSEAKTTPPVAHAGPIDGRQYSASIVRDDADEDEESRPLVDRLIFSDGMFSSEICTQYNFTEAPYWTRMEGDQVHFLVELTSPTDGTMLWKGIIRGDTLEGTMRWTKKRWYWTIDTEHKIRGRLDKGLSAASASSN
jgi:hypothetical protein